MAYGLRPAGHKSGVPIKCNVMRQWRIASGYASNIFNGDVVTYTTDGTITLATAGIVPVGVFAGCSYKDSTGAIIYSKRWTASTTASDIKADVYDDPLIIFKCEADQDTTPITNNSIGENADIVYVTGNANTGLSGSSFDSSGSAAATATLRLVRSADVTDTIATSVGTAVPVLVYFNEHLFTTTGTAGV